MAPNTKEVVAEDESEWDFQQVHDDPNNIKPRPPTRLVWRNIIYFAILHVGAVTGVYQVCTTAQYKSVVWAYLLYLLSGLGITAGAHRLWTHRSYKAKTGLRIVLMIWNCIAFQNDVLEWSRDHRVHHKYSETDADPHNARRGFFFAHIGWLLCRKHPDVIEKGRGIDISDLWADPVVRFQRRHYLKLVFLLSVVIPVWVPMYFWNEYFWTSLNVCVFMRYCWSVNLAWLVNSAAHLWGHTPYDKTINPRDNQFVAYITAGEAWHNYHHTFPMDYKASEVPYLFSMTTPVIDIFAKMGWAYDLKSVPKHVVEKRKERTGGVKEGYE